MKKWLSILLIVMLVFTLSACGKNNTESSGEQSGQHPSEITEPKDSEGEDQGTDTLNNTDDETEVDKPDGQSEPVSNGDEVSGNTDENGNGTDPNNDPNDASDDAEAGNVPTELDSTDEVVIEISEDEGVGGF